MSDAPRPHDGDVPHDGIEVEAAPDPRLLVLLIALLAVGVSLMFVTARSDPGHRVTLGSIDDLAQRAAAGPVRLVDLPHLVVMRTPTRSSPIYQQRWGENTGSLLLSDQEQLVVLETTDPVDDAPLTWCRSRGVFEHPAGQRVYAPDGLLLAGDGRRGMDRRALGLTGAAVVEVDDGRWVSGIPRRVTDTSWTARGESCVGDG